MHGWVRHSAKTCLPGGHRPRSRLFVAPAHAEGQGGRQGRLTLLVRQVDLPSRLEQPCHQLRLAHRGSKVQGGPPVLVHCKVQAGQS